MRCCWTAALWKRTERESLPLSWSSTRCQTAEDHCQARPEWRASQRRHKPRSLPRTVGGCSPWILRRKQFCVQRNFFSKQRAKVSRGNCMRAFPSAGAAGPWWRTDGSCPLANKCQTDWPVRRLSNNSACCLFPHSLRHSHHCATRPWAPLFLL